MKPLWLMLGLIALAVGVIGVFLPLIPTTGPLLIAAYAFGKSSDRLHDWLMNHPRFGRFISDFRAGRGIPMRTKVVALIAMTAAFTYSVGWFVPTLPLKLLVAAVGVWAISYVARIPVTRHEEGS